MTPECKGPIVAKFKVFVIVADHSHPIKELIFIRRNKRQQQRKKHVHWYIFRDISWAHSSKQRKTATVKRAEGVYIIIVNGCLLLSRFEGNHAAPLPIFFLLPLVKLRDFCLVCSSLVWLIFLFCFILLLVSWSRPFLELGRNLGKTDSDYGGDPLQRAWQ